MLVLFLSLLGTAQAGTGTCKSGVAPMQFAYNGLPFKCSSRTVESLVCPMYHACEYVDNDFVCCPYAAESTCNRYFPSTATCPTAHTECTLTKEYGCMESNAVTSAVAAGITVTNISTLPFITGSCFNRCGVAGWSSRTLGPPNPNTACSCTSTCWTSNTCCSDYPFYCSYMKQSYGLFPANYPASA